MKKGYFLFIFKSLSLPLLSLFCWFLFSFCSDSHNNSNTNNNPTKHNNRPEQTTAPIPLTSDDNTTSANDLKKYGPDAHIEGSSSTNIETMLIGTPRKLPIYGFNGNITKSASWSNKAFRDSVKSLGLKIIRYPGGTISNLWDWRKGGFMDLNKASFKINKLENFGEQNTVSNTLDDLKLLVDEAHCDVVFTLNMVSSTLDDQIAMLQKAQSLGMRVKYIELGNEFNLKENIAKEKFPTPADYGRTCAQWITKLRSNFPAAEIAMVGGNKQFSAAAKNWNNQVLSYAVPDALVSHVYALPEKVIDNDGINFASLYEGFINRFNNQGFQPLMNKVALWVTEYNIQWAQEKNNPDAQKYAFTWGQSLATIMMTSLCTSLSNKTELILNYNIGNNSVFAALETEKKTFRKLPSGIGMELWLRAVNNMSAVQKVRCVANSRSMEDYEVIGWKFSNSNSTQLLFANFTSNSININIQPLIGRKTVTCTVKSADKNSIVINNPSVISTQYQTLNTGIVTLPAFGVVVVK